MENCNKENLTNEIDQQIYALSYNPQEILIDKGEAVTSFVPKSGRTEGNLFIEVTRERKNVHSESYEIGMTDAIVDLTFPGSILRANSSLVDNRPDIIVTKRKPLKFRVDLPGMTEDAVFSTQNPNYLSVSTELNKVLNIYDDKYVKTHPITARVQYSSTMAYSSSQLNTSLGIELKFVSKKLNIDFASISEKKTSVMIVSFKQIFYTVSSELQSKPSNYFDNSVTWDDLKRNGIDSNNPPVIVSNVAYGRTIYVKLETNSTDAEVETAFKAIVKDNSTEVKTKYKSVLDNTSFTAYILGGSIEQIKMISVKNMDEINKVIQDYSVYSKSNPGYPISYKTQFIKDNQLAFINSTTEYVQTICKEYTSGKFELNHDGGYVAQFHLSWDVFTFDENGGKVVTKKCWHKNDKDMTSHFNESVQLPANSENIYIRARECTGLAWEWWRIVFEHGGIQLISHRKLSIWGTTLHPKHSIDPGV